ncbi:uncharacterized protein LOC114915426 [Cajanus cajan]|uniref:uncharacterized protein LOC114915426 n=1 Tax=Cajanus cajan TaxID=3821 RepID=UPI0010FB717C|nr:uncharacterized protein LOC114915426 [Cajanus cajan]
MELYEVCGVSPSLVCLTDFDPPKRLWIVWELIHIRCTFKASDVTLKWSLYLTHIGHKIGDAGCEEKVISSWNHVEHGLNDARRKERDSFLPRFTLGTNGCGTGCKSGKGSLLD